MTTVKKTQLTQATLKKLLFPVQQVAAIVASWATAILFFVNFFIFW